VADANTPIISPQLLAKLGGNGEGSRLERLAGAFRDIQSGLLYPDIRGVPSLCTGVEQDGSGITRKIHDFYEEYPFPNYEGLQSFGDLVVRGQENPFAKDLLAAIGYNKLILECGCGTGQLSHYLSLNGNHVLGVDLSLSSLRAAIDFKLRCEIPRSSFVQMNIFELKIKEESFDVVISTGVLHHTKDARKAFASIATKAKVGGKIVVGLYNNTARWPTWFRSKLIGLLGPRIDYVVRNRIRDANKSNIWIKDQYYNPHETWHSIDEVLEWFRENNIRFLSCHPAIWGAKAGAGNVFAPTNPSSWTMRMLTQLAWLGTIAREGALFVMVGERLK
jgi:SAM-dependent methyltransferase